MTIDSGSASHPATRSSSAPQPNHHPSNLRKQTHNNNERTNERTKTSERNTSGMCVARLCGRSGLGLDFSFSIVRWSVGSLVCVRVVKAISVDRNPPHPRQPTKRPEKVELASREGIVDVRMGAHDLLYFAPRSPKYTKQNETKQTKRNETNETPKHIRDAELQHTNGKDGTHER